MPVERLEVVLDRVTQYEIAHAVPFSPCGRPRTRKASEAETNARHTVGTGTDKRATARATERAPGDVRTGKPIMIWDDGPFRRRVIPVSRPGREIITLP
ncbi:hypothetical protein GCM10017559_73730 [Streptosporangium longisporum]|uniref:Transposase n=1 Tax=Streptosporangium longisporum TaxID=46187 RepID=A0ABP6LCA8_9ACTN